ncbi:MAG TPA: HPF/RaiA family ribosome-associated protein [Bryobacteraceae bacterium]|nr:HPF/RaiA family ribosome-associated protein [Bryobacteraceae bacterium]
MLFFVQTVIDATMRATLKKNAERRLHFATDRFEGHICDVGVVLRDVNGPHGGIDKVCRVIATLRRGGRLEVEEKRASFMAAISAAAKRLRRLLARRIGGKAARYSIRRDREPYRRRWRLV